MAKRCRTLPTSLLTLDEHVPDLPPPSVDLYAGTDCEANGEKTLHHIIQELREHVQITPPASPLTFVKTSMYENVKSGDVMHAFRKLVVELRRTPESVRSYYSGYGRHSPFALGKAVYFGGTTNDRPRTPFATAALADLGGLAVIAHIETNIEGRGFGSRFVTSLLQEVCKAPLQHEIPLVVAEYAHRPFLDRIVSRAYGWHFLSTWTFPDVQPGDKLWAQLPSPLETPENNRRTCNGWPLDELHHFPMGIHVQWLPPQISHSLRGTALPNFYWMTPLHRVRCYLYYVHASWGESFRAPSDDVLAVIGALADLQAWYASSQAAASYQMGGLTFRLVAETRPEIVDRLGRLNVDRDVQVLRLEVSGKLLASDLWLWWHLVVMLSRTFWRSVVLDRSVLGDGGDARKLWMPLHADVEEVWLRHLFEEEPVAFAPYHADASKTDWAPVPPSAFQRATGWWRHRRFEAGHESLLIRHQPPAKKQRLEVDDADDFARALAAAEPPSPPRDAMDLDVDVEAMDEDDDDDAEFHFEKNYKLPKRPNGTILVVLDDEDDYAGDPPAYRQCAQCQKWRPIEDMVVTEGGSFVYCNRTCWDAQRA